MHGRIRNRNSPLPRPRVSCGAAPQISFFTWITGPGLASDSGCFVGLTRCPRSRLIITHAAFALFRTRVEVVNKSVYRVRHNRCSHEREARMLKPTTAMSRPLTHARLELIGRRMLPLPQPALWPSLPLLL